MHRLFFSRIYLFILTIVLAAPSSVSALTPNDPLLSEQWYLQTIHAYEGWDITTGNSEVVVAVLDTGVDLNHPDLADNIWINAGEIPDDFIDNDQNGFVDDVYGWDFVDDDASPVPNADEEFEEDAVMHGTLIAGAIGAVGNNQAGIAGLNWSVRIMPIRILDNLGSGNSQDARRAVRYAIENGADVINLSFTGFDVDPSFQQAIQDAYESGVTVVAAVGNDENGGIDTDGKPIYPACFMSEDGDDWVIGVAATDQGDAKAAFSNYGGRCTDLSAPGEGIFGTAYEDSDWADFSQAYRGGWNGTSIAAPFVTGTVALLKSQYPSLTPKQIKTILQLSVDPAKTTEATIGRLGAGRLNVARALSIASGFVTESALVVPTSSKRIAVASAQGASAEVKVFTRDGERITTFNAYGEGFADGVRLAMGDVDGDGTEEIITVPASGGGPHVRVFELEGTVRSEFFAFEESDRTGWFVATGDVNGDGVEEILLSEDGGGNGEVEIRSFDGSLLGSVFPFDRTPLSVRVAAGDIDGDGVDEILTVPGNGMAPRIRVIEADGTFVREWNTYAETYDRGVFVASGDINGDGVDEIVTGTDNGGGPHVRVFDAYGTVLASFFAYDEKFRGGVRLSVANLNGKEASIITAAGPGGGPHVRVFTGGGKVIGGFFAAEEAGRSGINVSGWGL